MDKLEDIGMFSHIREALFAFDKENVVQTKGGQITRKFSKGKEYELIRNLLDEDKSEHQVDTETGSVRIKGYN